MPNRTGDFLGGVSMWAATDDRRVVASVSAIAWLQVASPGRDPAGEVVLRDGDVIEVLPAGNLRLGACPVWLGPTTMTIQLPGG